MRILVVGGGAREHALAWKCAQSDLVERVLVAPGNGGTGGLARNVSLAVDDVAGLARLVREEGVDLTVLGPEAAVAAGVGDAIRDLGGAVFGPGRDAGRIETSKAFAKHLMRRAGIPSAEFAVFTQAEPARNWARERQGRVAVKADGLAQGKGVSVCDSVEESDQAIDEMLLRGAFGEAARTIVVEERLQGPELSVFGLSDGRRVVALAPARDYKRALDGDQGPNTGGMGAYSPPLGVDQELVQEAVRTVLEPAVTELAALGMEYRGVLYAGLMLTSAGMRCIEFNARFGDPETQAILPRLESDLVPLLQAAAAGDLEQVPPPRWSRDAAVVVVVVSGGYPGPHQTGLPVRGLAEAPAGVLFFHGATRFDRRLGLVSSGGRVVSVVGRGSDVSEARRRALLGAARVALPGAYHRTDIAQEALQN
ncbi:MAG TPA: phosphoribosylamine--glycine ligase [Candidatus Nitrosotalea sp.]|nr:phosphoribosylamine--glycine ligase [Candidatus Nitrosotalea sp.]